MVYSGQAEIQAYIRACAEKYELMDHIRFETTVDSASFDEATGTWALETSDGERSTHRLLIAATGGLAEPNLPRIEGYDTFEGDWWHSGSWRSDVDLSDKRVAVVGSAASAVTVVPTVAEDAAEVFVFSRSPNWVVPRRNALYSDEEKAAFAADDELRRTRRRYYRNSLLMYRAFKRHDRAIATLRRVGMDNLRSAIDDPALVEVLTPDFDPGCKRILVSDHYYPALAQPHVQLIPEGVVGLTANGIVAADGSETEVDVVIFCTGYAPGTPERRRVALEVVGPGGRSLSAALADNPEVYRGAFLFVRPKPLPTSEVHGVVSYASYFDTTELETEYLARWAQRFSQGDLKSVEARRDLTHDYNETIQAELQQMSWTGNCTNFYKNREGRILSFFPGTVGRMRRELRDLRQREFIITPR